MESVALEAQTLLTSPRDYQSRTKRWGPLRSRTLSRSSRHADRLSGGIPDGEDAVDPSMSPSFQRLDEMWSYVRSKANPRWLWHAIDHHTGKVLAYVFGRRQDDVFLKLQELLAPFGITKFYTDGWGAYERHLDAAQHQVGKENTQKIESKHINLRTRIKRLVRRTLCFSKTERMHDLVIGLFINRYEFGQPL
jgi:insertion element IS1 protein InsB